MEREEGVGGGEGREGVQLNERKRERSVETAREI